MSIPSPPCSCGGRFTITGWRDGGIPCSSARGRSPRFICRPSALPWPTRGPVLLERSAGQERPLTLVGADATVVERLEDAFPGRFAFTSQRGDFDYIYRTRDLAELPGERLSRQTQPHRWFFPEIQLDL